MHATLSIDISAIAVNYRLLQSRHATGNVAAVVKADAYGLGVEAVARALWQEGCRQFFVATLEEGIELRGYLPEAVIGVFGGLHAGEEGEYGAHRLVPVLNDGGQVERFVREDSGFRIQDSGFLHIDTGMTRLGLSETELGTIFPRIPNPESRILLMTHLATANDPTHPKNAEQLTRFQAAQRLCPGLRTSMANSSGLFLPEAYHGDLARPGCALYGINPTEDANPMQQVATLSAPLLQIRTLDRDETVGYGATASLPKGSRLAIAGLGYADGWLRDLSNKGFAWIEDIRVPICGRVSMDMIALDVSAIPESQITPASRAYVINARQTVDDIARQCGTIGYEVFTRIGARVRRVYV